MSPTKRQQDALRFIRGHELAKGYAPTLCEIKDGLGYAAHSRVFCLLEGLEERSLVRRLHNRARAMETLVDIAVPRSPEGEPLYFVEIGE